MPPIPHPPSPLPKYALAAILALSPRLFALTPTSYIGPDQDLWSNPLNWDNGLPNNSTFDVTINSATPLTVQLDANETINNLTLGALNTLYFQTGKILTVANMTNSGTVLVSGIGSKLQFSNRSISGGGSIVLSQASVFLPDASSSDNIISGQGTISGLSLNTGTITATSGTLNLSGSNGPPFDITNNGLLGADHAALLLKSPVDYGLINITQTGTLILQSGVLHTVTLTNAGLVSIPSFASLSGTITNNGLIQAHGIIDCNSTTTLGGSGTLSLSGVTMSVPVGGPARTLYNSNLITGTADIRNIKLNNSGTITASGGSLYLQPSLLPDGFLNNGMLSTNNGILILSGGGTVSNSGSILLTGTLSVLSLASDISMAGNGSIVLSSTSSKITGTSGVRLITDNLISGSGSIGLASLKVTNSGTITATTGSLTLAPKNTTDGFYNTGGLLADGGTLVLSNGTFSNASGLIQAAANSVVSITTSTIVGGAVHAKEGGTISISNSTLNGVDLSGTIVTSSSSTLSGSLTNSSLLSLAGGTINFGTAASPLFLKNSGTLQLGQSVPASNIPISLLGDTTLSGGGTLILNGNSINGTGQTVTAERRLTTDNMIVGSGSLGLGHPIFITNSGTVSAMDGVLTIYAEYGSNSILNYNSGMLRAQGGTLNLRGSGTALTIPSLLNANGTIEAVANSVVVLDHMAVSGGTLRAQNGGTITMLGSLLGSVACEGTFQLSGEPSYIYGPLTTTGTFSMTGTSTLPGLVLVLGRLNSPTTSLVNPHTWQLTSIYSVRMDSPVSLSGGGSLSIQDISLFGRSNYRLTTDNYISGFGTLGTSDGYIKITNTGTIKASNGLLILQHDLNDALLNLGTLASDPGSTLTIYGGQISNATGRINAAPHSTINFYASISGGDVHADGTMNFNASSQTDALTGMGTLSIGPTVTLSATHLHIDAQTLTLAPSSALRQSPSVLLPVSTLTLAPTTTLDTTNHDLMIGNSNLATIQAQILKGFNKAGNPTDPAITSSTALANNNTFLVPIDADALLGTGSPKSAIGYIFDGIAITQPHTVLLKYAYLGDITLDGIIDGLDLATASGNYLQTTPGITDIQTSWLLGDINLDGIVNDTDFQLMNTNSTASQLSPLGALHLTPVPEPTTLALLALALPPLLTRRKTVPVASARAWQRKPTHPHPI